jgi:glycosyltransferase involved in cell wall biosynthesis
MRVMKVAIPLIERGHEVHLIVEKITQFSNKFETISVYWDLEQLYAACRLHLDADIFHCHNEPSWFVTVLKDLGVNAPVILDVHDSCLLRKTSEEWLEQLESGHPDGAACPVSIDERNNMQLADGLIFVCDPMQEICTDTYNLQQPSLVLPSYVNKRFIRIDFSEWYGGLVYQGRIDTSTELPDRWRSFFQYSDYREMGDKCREIGMDFHIYTSRGNEKVRREYDKHVILHEPQQYDKLIKVIARHDWGLVGNIRPHTEWRFALPNKLFEYLAGSTPVVSMHAEECSKFIEEHGVGITVSSVEELADRWSEHHELRKQVVAKRHQFTMERYIKKVEDFYNQLRTGYQNIGLTPKRDAWSLSESSVG